MRLALGFPTGDLMFANCAINLALVLAGACHDFKEVHVLHQRSSQIANGREKLCREALGANADYLLMLDSDHIFPADIAGRMVARGLPILGIDQSNKASPFRNVAQGLRRDFGMTGGVPLDGDEPVEVESCGCAAFLVSREVLLSMPEPRWQIGWDETNKTYIGEDYSFCRRARLLGYKIFIDPAISRRTAHVGTHNFMPRPT